MKKIFLLLTMIIIPATCSILAQVGINSNSATNKLHVVGDDVDAPVRIDNILIAPADEVDSQAFLVADKATGEVYKGRKASAPFYYFTYELKNVDKDWVSNFDTKIPTNEYTLIIVGSAFSNKLAVRRIDVTRARDYYDYFGPLVVRAFNVDSATGTPYNTWRIQADYIQATAVEDDSNNGVNGTWTLYCMVIANTEVTNLGEYTVSFSGNSSASAPNPLP